MDGETETQGKGYNHSVLKCWSCRMENGKTNECSQLSCFK